MIVGAIGELLVLLTQKPSHEVLTQKGRGPAPFGAALARQPCYHEVLTQKVEALHSYFAEVPLRQVLDLGSAATLAALGLKTRDLRRPWVGARTPTVTQCLGEAVGQQTAITARLPKAALATWRRPGG